MYAEKRRQKRWHDKKVRTKEFQPGDLVLLYTLKNQKRKLKLRGLGPFIINEITNGGAVRLATLDGEPMGTFINGSRLKHFHEPLTDDMLERMHAAKSQKLAFEQLKADAQAEAKERAAKAKARRLQVSMVQVNEVATEDYTDPLLVPLGIVSPQVTCTAILDSRSGCECHVGTALPRPTNQHTLTINSNIHQFLQSTNRMHGYFDDKDLYSTARRAMHILCYKHK